MRFPQSTHKISTRRLLRHGFTLIELAIVLGVVGTITAGLWRLSTNSNQQTKDTLTAQQHAALIAAVKGFLNDNSSTGGQVWLTGKTAGTGYNLDLPTSCSPATGNNQGLCNYLPAGFTKSTTNPYGQTYVVQVLAGATTANYSFMIVTSGGNTIPDADGGRIASLIGSDGGFIYTSNVCGTPATTACGAMGGWSVTTVAATYGFASTASGEVASLSSPSSASVVNPQWLARTVMPGDTTSYTYNTMATDLFMGTYVAGTDTAPTTGTPSMHIHNGFIEGDGSTISPQINLAYLNAPNSTSSTPQQLIYANSKCSVTQTTLFQATPNGPLPVCNDAIYAAGDIGSSGQIKGQKIYSASDARLKKDIRPLKNELYNLMKIDAVSFTFKAGGSKSMGVIAQNIEKVYPQLVSAGQDGIKYVEYNGLIGPLISAVQQLEHENAMLREQVKTQSQRIDRLEQKDTGP